jgi:hypothetical protein
VAAAAEGGAIAPAVTGNARIYGDAVIGVGVTIYVSELYAGKWNRTPVYILGSRHPVSQTGPDTVGIGCLQFPIDYWLDNYEAIGRKYQYTPLQIEEYGCYLRAIQHVIEGERGERTNEDPDAGICID